MANEREFLAKLSDELRLVARLIEPASGFDAARARGIKNVLERVDGQIEEREAHLSPSTTPAAPTEVPYTRGPMDQRERLDEPKDEETYDDQEDKKLRIMCEGLRGHFEGVVKKALHVRTLEKASDGGIISDSVVRKLLRNRQSSISALKSPVLSV